MTIELLPWTVGYIIMTPPHVALHTNENMFNLKDLKIMSRPDSESETRYRTISARMLSTTQSTVYETIIDSSKRRQETQTEHLNIRYQPARSETKHVQTTTRGYGVWNKIIYSYRSCTLHWHHHFPTRIANAIAMPFEWKYFRLIGSRALHLAEAKVFIMLESAESWVCVRSINVQHIQVSMLVHSAQSQWGC